MGKRRRQEQENSPAQPSSITLSSVPSCLMSSSALDPALTSLFATSSGPVTAPSVSRTSKQSAPTPARDYGGGDEEDEEVADPSDSDPGDEDEFTSESSPGPTGDLTQSSKPLPREQAADSRKRKRNTESEDVENVYMRRLMREEAAEDRKREIKRKLNRHTGIRGADESGAGESDSEDNSTDDVPQHESLSTTVASSEENKTARTVFLGNVSTQAIKSKSAKKILLTHLSKFLKHLPDRDVPHKIESLRFRSTAFNVTVGPKKAAFAKKELMDSTTKSTNAYVVYSTEGAARRAVSTLNGTIVLDRHLRVDSIANPSTIDQRRCIFVGNLGFVDKEILDDNNDEDDKASRRNKAKEPADAEEGLWRTFSKVGTVESVRVVRDKSTRIGKGIAYVQFKDKNAVEAALLYNDKKFPPLLPRKLRVSRTRKIRKHYPQSTSTASASRSRDKFKQGGQMQSFKRSKRPDAAGKGSTSGARKPGPFVFEGYRASSADGKPRLKGRGKSDGKARKGKPTTRSSRRGAAFKAGGKKIHD